MRKKSLLFPLGVIGLELVVGLLGIVAFLSFLLIVFRQHLDFFDKTIIQSIYAIRSDWMTELMKGITFLGGEIFITGGILILLAVIFRKHKITSFNFSVLLFFGTIVNLVLKWLYQRPRPDYLPLAFESTYSFPSGHAMNSFIFYACLAYFIHRTTTSKKVRIFTFLFFGILVGLIGMSRVYLGVHYPSDVLAGYLGGILWFGIVVLVERTAHKYKLFTKFL